jgi:hypothetical protein
VRSTRHFGFALHHQHHQLRTEVDCPRVTINFINFAQGVTREWRVKLVNFQASLTVNRVNFAFQLTVELPPLSANGAPFQSISVGLREAEFFGTKPSGPLNFDVFVEPRTGCPQGDPHDPGSSETNESEKNG